MDNTCLFCNIVADKIPSHQVWVDEEFVAFLSIFPNTPGVTVVIPKKHYDSYFAQVEEGIVDRLIKASRIVAKKIDSAFPDVGRTGLIFEGFGVNHLHAKLFPMHGTSDMEKWSPIETKSKIFYDKYPGFLTSADYDMASPEELKRTAEMIRSAV